jgi:hypothetical protein
MSDPSVEIRTAPDVIHSEEVRVENVILFDNLTSDVAHEHPEIGRSDVDILGDHNSLGDELHFGMPGDCDNELDKIDKNDAIPIPSQQ